MPSTSNDVYTHSAFTFAQKCTDGVLGIQHHAVADHVCGWAKPVVSWVEQRPAPLLGPAGGLGMGEHCSWHVLTVGGGRPRRGAHLLLAQCTTLLEHLRWWWALAG